MGTTVELPDTAANRLAYPQTRQGNGCPLSRLVGVFCLSSGSLLNAAIGPFAGKGTGEQSLLRSLLDTFSTGDVVVGDAYFGSYFLLAELQRRGVMRSLSNMVLVSGVWIFVEASRWAKKIT